MSSKTFQNSQIPNLVSSFTGFKNRIINGDFSVWQRGKSFNIKVDSDNSRDDPYIVDRFYSGIYNGTAGELSVYSPRDNTVRIETVTPVELSTETGDDNKITTGYHGIATPIEGNIVKDIILNKEDFVVSFNFKSNKVGKYQIAAWISGVFEDGIYKSANFITTFDYTTPDVAVRIVTKIPFSNYPTELRDYIRPLAENDWRAKGITVMIGGYFTNAVTDTVSKWVSDSTRTGYPPLTVNQITNWATEAGNYIEISELQLEKGEKATDFEYLPYDIQLIRCRRYFYSTLYPHFDTGILTGAVTTNAFNDIDFTQRTYEFQTPMRVTPTITTYAFVSGTKNAFRDRTNNTDISGPSIGSETNTNLVYFYKTERDLTQGNLYSWHFTADAEL